MRPRTAMRTMAAVLLACGIAGAAAKTSEPRSDADVANGVVRAISLYRGYGTFDAVSLHVRKGVVTLHGAVTASYKKSGIGRIAAQVPGVAGVDNELQVLPASIRDDDLRALLAFMIFRDPVLAQSSIHIIVNNGCVELVGTVHTSAQKAEVARRANAVMTFGMAVNNLRVG